jgi:hypothetical protein
VFVFVFGEVGPGCRRLDVTNWVAQLFVMVAALSWCRCSTTRHGRLGRSEADKQWASPRPPAGSWATVKPAVARHEHRAAGAAVLVIRTTDLWWLYGWYSCWFSIGLGFLFTSSSSIFNKFTPLEEGELSRRIDAVARMAGVDISGAYVADESRRSRRDNAYVAGLGATRRVVLFDTLLEHPPAVVEQVVAHEIGHWRRPPRQIPLAAVLSFLVPGFLLPSEWDWLFQQAAPHHWVPSPPSATRRRCPSCRPVQAGRGHRPGLGLVSRASSC